MEVKGKFRNYTVRIVPNLIDGHLVDEKYATLLIRRDYLRPWRMLAALVAAMNDVAGRDDAWATRNDAKPMMLGTHRLLLGGKEWRLQCCSVLSNGVGKPDPASLRVVDVDYETSEIRVCTRFNLGFGAPALAEAIAQITHDGVYELIEDVHASIAGRDLAASSRRFKADQTADDTAAA